LIRTNPDLVRRTAQMKGSDVDVERLITADAHLRRSQARMEELRGTQKRQSRDLDAAAARALKEELRTITEEVRELQAERDDLWARVPNLIADDTPSGEDDTGNVELRREGDPVPADERRVHDAIGSRLKIFDMA